MKQMLAILLALVIPACALGQTAPDEPPIGWLLEITLPNVPAGLAAW